MEYSHRSLILNLRFFSLLSSRSKFKVQILDFVPKNNLSKFSFQEYGLKNYITHFNICKLAFPYSTPMSKQIQPPIRITTREHLRVIVPVDASQVRQQAHNTGV